MFKEEIDFSNILVSQKQVNFTFYLEEIPQFNVINFEVAWTPELLSPIYRSYLNPLEISITSVMNLPVNNISDQVYVKYQLYDEPTIVTKKNYKSNKVKIQENHVYLTNFMDEEQLIHNLENHKVHFEVHDKDIEVPYTEELIPEPEPIIEEAKKKGKAPAPKKEVKKAPPKKGDAKVAEPVFKQQREVQYLDGEFGLSSFKVSDLLKENGQNLKLVQHLVPVRDKKREYEEGSLEAKEAIELNTLNKTMVTYTQQKSTYFENDCYLTVKFNLHQKVGTFFKAVNEEEAAKTQQKEKFYARIIYIIPYKDTENFSTKEFLENLYQYILNYNFGLLPENIQQSMNDPSLQNLVKYLSDLSLGKIQEDTKTKKVEEYKKQMEEMKAKEQPVAKKAPAKKKAGKQVKEVKTVQENPEMDEEIKKIEEQAQKCTEDLEFIQLLQILDKNSFRLLIVEGELSLLEALYEQIPRPQQNSSFNRTLKNFQILYKQPLYKELNLGINFYKFKFNLTEMLVSPSLFNSKVYSKELYNICHNIQQTRKA